MISLSLNELTLDNVGQLPAPIKLGAVGFLSLLLIFAGYWLIVKDNFAQYSTLQAEEATLKTTYEGKQRQASNLQAYRNQLAIMEERFGNMLKQLPTQNEMPGLLEDISKTGIASGLTFELFAPLPEVVHDFYIEVPIKIAVRGNYHQFGLFLSRVAQMSRIVTLHDFVISSGSPENGKPKISSGEQLSGDRLNMEITAKIYRYRTQ